MKTRYIAVYKIHGANKLPNDTEQEEFCALEKPAIKTILSANPEPHFDHIDKSAAIGTQLLKGMFAPDKEGTLEERLAAEIEAIKASRIQRTGNGVFLIIEGEQDTQIPEFKVRKDTQDFAISLDDISKPEIRNEFQAAVKSIILALGLSLSPNADRRVEKIGEVIFLVDPNDEKPIYIYNIQGGVAHCSVSSPLTQEIIDEAISLAPSLLKEKKIARPVSLLTTSLEDVTNELQTFISAWSALEIFANATFKETYQECWFQIMKSGAPDAANPVFERFQDVMKDKYRLTDKFLIIASVLDPDNATTDADKFSELKKVRDGLLHALDTPQSPLPIGEIQNLLLKYMKLHLNSKGGDEELHPK